MKKLFTIGYEGRTPEALMEALRCNEVDLLLDVRLRPNSRKPGFSKKALAAACERAGITYCHDAALGTPPDLLAHARQGEGYDAETSAAYRTHLLSQATDALDAAVQKAQSMRSCLLCFEANAQNCHRRIVAEEVGKRGGMEISHL